MYASDARQLPEKSKSFDIAFSFLADPYNDEGLWSEVDRILKQWGLWVVTLPSHLWASSFRRQGEKHISTFVLSDGSEADLPSFTYPVSSFVRNIEKQNLYLRKYTSLTTKDLNTPVSSKLHIEGSASSVLDCYIFEKIE